MSRLFAVFRIEMRQAVKRTICVVGWSYDT
jgi:hypothetical protein